MDDQTQPPGDLPPDVDDTRNTLDTPDTRDHDNALRDPRYGPTPDMEAENPEAGAVPPGYDWPTHGGYLGCLLAMMPACLLAGFISSTFVAWPWFNGKSILPTIAVVALILVTFAACILGFGRLGWVLGRRFYRKYPRGEPTWGEDDDAPGVSLGGKPAASPDAQDAEREVRQGSQDAQESAENVREQGEASEQARR